MAQGDIKLFPVQIFSSGDRSFLLLPPSPPPPAQQMRRLGRAAILLRGRVRRTVSIRPVACDYYCDLGIIDILRNDNRLGRGRGGEVKGDRTRYRNGDKK